MSSSPLSSGGMLIPTPLTAEVEVSREGSYFDGTALQSAFSRDQTVIRAILRADWQPLHTAAFAEVNGIFPS